MDFSRFNLGKRKLVIMGCIIILLIISVFFYIYWDKTQQKKAVVEESAEDLEMLIVEAEQNTPQMEKMLEFIYEHLPYNYDMLDVQVLTTLEVKLHELEDVKKSNAEKLNALCAKLLNGLKRNDVSLVLGTFKTAAYLDYINQFLSPEEKEKGLQQFVETLNRNNTLVKLGYILDESKKSVEIVFYYEDGLEIGTSLNYTTYRDIHKSSKSNEYVFNTPFEEIEKHFID